MARKMASILRGAKLLFSIQTQWLVNISMGPYVPLLEFNQGVMEIRKGAVGANPHPPPDQGLIPRRTTRNWYTRGRAAWSMVGHLDAVPTGTRWRWERVIAVSYHARTKLKKPPASLWVGTEFGDDSTTMTISPPDFYALPLGFNRSFPRFTILIPSSREW